MKKIISTHERYFEPIGGTIETPIGNGPFEDIVPISIRVYLFQYIVICLIIIFSAVHIRVIAFQGPFRLQYDVPVGSVLGQ